MQNQSVAMPGAVRFGKAWRISEVSATRQRTGFASVLRPEVLDTHFWHSDNQPLSQLLTQLQDQSSDASQKFQAIDSDFKANPGVINRVPFRLSKEEFRYEFLLTGIEAQQYKPIADALKVAKVNFSRKIQALMDAEILGQTSSGFGFPYKAFEHPDDDWYSAFKSHLIAKPIVSAHDPNQHLYVAKEKYYTQAEINQLESEYEPLRQAYSEALQAQKAYLDAVLQGAQDLKIAATYPNDEGKPRFNLIA